MCPNYTITGRISSPLSSQIVKNGAIPLEILRVLSYETGVGQRFLSCPIPVS